MVRIKVISPTYKWGITWGYNPLILPINPNFQRDISSDDQQVTKGCSTSSPREQSRMQVLPGWRHGNQGGQGGAFEWAHYGRDFLC